jgi:hypothetical protein
MNIKKRCETCKKPLIRRPRESPCDFKKRRFCSRTCSCVEREMRRKMELEQRA